jgi:plastocyanin
VGRSTTPSATPTATATATPSIAATTSAVDIGTADFTLGTAAVKVGMTGDATAPGGAHFVPADVSVHVGDIVEWDYSPTAFVPHNIVFADAPSVSNRIGLGAKANGDRGAGTWQVRFTLAGQYGYVCTFHPGMTGTVAVH